MSSLANTVKKNEKAKRSMAVENFMGGVSFEMDPMTTLRMVSASSIFSEPQYYRNSPSKPAYLRNAPKAFAEFTVLETSGKKTDEYMEEIIDKALDYDFEAVLDFAAELRNDYFMRLNPQVIMVRAAMHPNRVKFTSENPDKFKEIQKIVMSRADEPSMQFAYYLWRYGSKKGLPSILKRTWANKLSSLNRYQIAKYKHAELGMIDTVRVCRAKSELLDELMKTGTVEVLNSEKTWENLKSEGKSWKEILTDEKFKMPHMALLRNLRGIALELDETEDRELMKSLLKQLVSGVEKGKQFPFRYYSAYKAIEYVNSVPFKVMILESLEECLQVSLNNLPELEGKTMVLSDNSGSAWGTITSEYGSVCVADIGNLSAVLTAMRSDEGYVGVFGNELHVIPVKKNASILDTLKTVSEAGKKVGGDTENGIWLFFEDAIENHVHWDNIFVYSDMQAGYGELYCTFDGGNRYRKFKKEHPEAYGGVCNHDSGLPYVDVMSLLGYYRKHVNPKTNMFAIQTAGYNNAVLPQYCYRSNILYGWTGKEVVFAKEMIDQWNAIENKQKENAQ